MDNFSDRLKHARQMRGYTQHELARVSGVSQSAIGSYESGERRSSRSAHRLAQALKVNLVWLETGAGAMMPAASHATPALREPQPGEHHDVYAWPFSGISADQYYALNAEQQRMIDAVLKTILREFQAAAPVASTQRSSRRGNGR
ncbi:helix-turn-helix domain-containing protein [Pseudomonadota bacterium AL_CKDN230030165-1A_HGKHYDSX7]